MNPNNKNTKRIKVETRTKVVCTLGPASSSKTVINELINAGMDVARINCAHGNNEEYKHLVSTLRSLSNRVAVMFDLAGPKIRVGEMKNNIMLQANNKLVLTTQPVLGNAEIVPQSYKELPSRVKKDDTIFVDEGLIHLK